MHALIAFLRARLDEDEQSAREAAADGPEWRLSQGAIYPSDTMSHPGVIVTGPYGYLDRVHGEHIARHDPAHVLADIEAKRRIIERAAGYADMEWIDDNPQRIGSGNAEEVLAEVLTLLALPFADNPDYDESWRP